MKKGTLLHTFLTQTQGVYSVDRLQHAHPLRQRLAPGQSNYLKWILSTGQEEQFAGLDGTVLASIDMSGNRDVDPKVVQLFYEIVMAGKFNTMATDALLFGAQVLSRWKHYEGQHRLLGIAQTPYIVILPIRVGCDPSVLLNAGIGVQVKPHMALYRWFNQQPGKMAPYIGLPLWAQGTMAKMVSVAKAIHTPVSAHRQGLNNFGLADLLNEWAAEIWDVVDQFHGLKTFKTAAHMAPFAIAQLAGMPLTPLRNALSVFTKKGNAAAMPLGVQVMHDALLELGRIPSLAGAHSRDKKERAAISVLLQALYEIWQGNGNHAVIPQGLAHGDLGMTRQVLQQFPIPTARLAGHTLCW